ncbi:MAG: hypothetical protein JO352_10310 [Chloroflexi bacterium]|nr:hypothetical protein [Chloroflexota bacterium]MBV9603238.1 hypothetical protein [Chloroflexota bacterium]
MQRPLGVTILALLAFVSGALHFLAAFLAFGAGSFISAGAMSGYYIPTATPFASAFGNLGFSIGLAGMIAATITLIAAGGLWVLSRGAGFWLATVILVVDLVLDIVALLGGNASAFTILGALFAVVALIYLWRPEVRHAFDGFPIDAPAS